MLHSNAMERPYCLEKVEDVLRNVISIDICSIPVGTIRIVPPLSTLITNLKGVNNCFDIVIK